VDITDTSGTISAAAPAWPRSACLLAWLCTWSSRQPAWAS
jgi:hypothetical protein